MDGRQQRLAEGVDIQSIAAIAEDEGLQAIGGKRSRDCTIDIQRVVDDGARVDDVNLIGGGDGIGEDGTVAVVRDGQDLAGYKAQCGARSGQGA